MLCCVLCSQADRSKKPTAFEDERNYTECWFTVVETETIGEREKIKQEVCFFRLRVCVLLKARTHRLMMLHNFTFGPLYSIFQVHCALISMKYYRRIVWEMIS